MKQLLQRFLLTASVAVMVMGLNAQESFIMDPLTLEAADTGYYWGGVEKDKDGDGINEFYNGCVDEYGDANHNEAGTQQGFTYNKSMIMPTCWPKNCYVGGDVNNVDETIATIDHPEGYIELTKTKYPGTDSAIMGYIITPVIKNLVSLTLESSCDASSGNGRNIYWWLEYSKDGGATWELTYIEEESTTKTGDLHTFDGSIYLEFQEMIDASKEGPIVLRLMTKPEQREGEDITYRSQRLKVHYLAVVAEEATSSISTPSISNEFNISIEDGLISIENEQFEVFNTLGQLIGSGKSVQVESGVYILRTASGATQKVLVK